MESKISLILGRPFLIKLSFRNMTLEVNIFNIAKQSPDKDECYYVDMIDTLVTDEFYKSHNKFDLLNYIFGNVDNESLFYLDNIIISTNFKTQDKRTKLQHKSTTGKQEAKTTHYEDPKKQLMSTVKVSYMHLTMVKALSGGSRLTRGHHFGGFYLP